MKRTALALTLIVALLTSAVSGEQVVKVAKAKSPPEPPVIQTPENKTYATNTISVYIDAYDPGRALVNIAYQLDGGAEVVIYAYPRPPWMTDFHHMGSGNAILDNLSDGLHHLRATATWVWWGSEGYSVSYSDVNFTVDTTKLRISVDSPQNMTYNKTEVPLIFTANKTASWAYSLDGQTNVTLSRNATLSGLSDGTHNLLVKATDAAGNFVLYMAYFAVDTKAPTISNASVNVSTHNATEASFDFTVNESVSWMGYSLDKEANVTINGNTTLTELSSGKHSLTIYSNDTAGNMGSSETIYFTVPEPFPTTWVATGIVSVAVVSACLLVYFNKRKARRFS